jgi:hypothetical protein
MSNKPVIKKRNLKIDSIDDDEVIDPRTAFKMKKDLIDSQSIEL